MDAGCWLVATGWSLTETWSAGSAGVEGQQGRCRTVHYVYVCLIGGWFTAHRAMADTYSLLFAPIRSYSLLVSPQRSLILPAMRLTQLGLSSISPCVPANTSTSKHAKPCCCLAC
ncbi:hypothetical protein B484DRAFT_443495, partial [Ochromonadaceae sp. CCMP2298]